MEAAEPERNEERQRAPVNRAGGTAATSPIVRVAIGFYAIVALFAFGYALFSRQIGTFLGEKAPTVPGLLGGLAVGLVIVALVHLGSRMWPAVATASQEVSNLVGPISVRDAAILAGVSSVAEELLFRGALWPQLGLAGTSLLFGLVHVVPKRALWGYPFYAAFAGLLLGLLRMEAATGSVVVPIVCHFTVNFLCLWWISREQKKVATDGGTSPIPAPDAPGPGTAS